MSPIPLLTQEQLGICNQLFEEYHHCSGDSRFARRAEIIRSLRAILAVDTTPRGFNREIGALAWRYRSASRMVVVRGRGLAAERAIIYLRETPAKVTAVNPDYTVDVALFDAAGKKVGGRGRVSPLSCEPIA